MRNAVNCWLSSFGGKIDARLKNNLKILQRLSRYWPPTKKLQPDTAWNGAGFILPPKG